MVRSNMIYLIFTLLSVALLSFFYFDKPIALFFHKHELKFFRYITQIGDAAIWIIPTLLLYLFYKKHKPLFAKKMLYIFSSVAVSGIIVDIFKPIIGRARPKILFESGFYGFEPFSFKASFWSLPSGHGATAFSAFVALALLYPRWRYPFFFLAFLTAFSRIALAKHYLSDVIVGSLIGSLTALILYKRFFDEA